MGACVYAWAGYVEKMLQVQSELFVRWEKGALLHMSEEM